MKYLSTLCAAASLVMLSVLSVGCDSDEGGSVNNLNVSVGFGQDVLSLKETVDFVTIPIVFDTEAGRNGDVIVHVTMSSSNAGFEADKDIILTTETVRIPASAESYDFEVGLNVETPGMDIGRNVEFKITRVEGASLGDNTTCRIDIIEKNFVEGLYKIEGTDVLYEYPADGSARITAQDETLDDVRLDFGIGSYARVKFTEIKPELEYDIEIEPFQFIGIYNTYNVHLTWMSKTKPADDDGSAEFYLGAYYDRTRPITGKFVRKIEDGVEVSQVITMNDGFGLLGTLEKRYSWFNNFVAKATLTKTE